MHQWMRTQPVDAVGNAEYQCKSLTIYGSQLQVLHGKGKISMPIQHGCLTAYRVDIVMWQVLDLAEGMGKKLGGKRALGGPATHPRVIPVLMCLADVYSRTGRVTLAEGLYR